jgi:hypothetical protein
MFSKILRLSLLFNKLAVLDYPPKMLEDAIPFLKDADLYYQALDNLKFQKRQVSESSIYLDLKKNKIGEILENSIDHIMKNVHKKWMKDKDSIKGEKEFYFEIGKHVIELVNAQVDQIDEPFFYEKRDFLNEKLSELSTAFLSIKRDKNPWDVKGIHSGTNYYNIDDVLSQSWQEQEIFEGIKDFISKIEGGKEYFDDSLYDYNNCKEEFEDSIKNLKKGGATIFNTGEITTTIVIDLTGWSGLSVLKKLYPNISDEELARNTKNEYYYIRNNGYKLVIIIKPELKGGHSGLWNYDNGTIEVAQDSFNNMVRTVAHELGHFAQDILSTILSEAKANVYKSNVGLGKSVNPKEDRKYTPSGMLRNEKELKKWKEDRMFQNQPSIEDNTYPQEHKHRRIETHTRAISAVESFIQQRKYNPKLTLKQFVDQNPAYFGDPSVPENKLAIQTFVRLLQQRGIV